MTSCRPPIILRPLAAPVYRFLAAISAGLAEGETLAGRNILDCGAGGPRPPLALFAQNGLEAYGIDISDAQLAKARDFARDNDLSLRLSQGDMRQIPFAGEMFDYVYEHYSMCHLSMRDTAAAIGEMHRVLKRGGLCFLGVISVDSQPKTFFGEEREPGEYVSEGDDDHRHTIFTDREAGRLVSNWSVVAKEKRVAYIFEQAQALSPEEWEAAYDDGQSGISREDWLARYSDRANNLLYSHLYFILRK